jgi:hypothetical protein
VNELIVSELLPPTDLLFIPHMINGYGKPHWNSFSRGKPNNWEKPYPIVTVYTTYKKWTVSGENPGLRGDRPDTNRLSRAKFLHE